MVFVWLFTVVAAPTHGRSLPVQLTRAADTGDQYCTSLEIRASPVREATAERDSVRTQAKVPGRINVELEPDVTYRITTEGDRCWTFPVEVAPGGPPILDLEVWPAGRVTGTLRGAEGEQLDRLDGLVVSVLVRFEGKAWPPPDGSRLVPAAGALDCSTAGTTFDCAIPVANSIGVRVALSGWITWYAWDLSGKPGNEIQLGEIVLARGASLSGWVLAEGASRRATAFVQPVGAERLSARQQEMLKKPCEIAGNGHFQCRDLAPGLWTVVVEPPPGFGGERRSPVEVKAGREVRLEEPIQLTRRFDLVVLADPPVAPGDRPWTTVLLRRADDGAHTVEVARQEASPAGEVVFAGVEPGSRIVELRDPDGNVLARAEEEVAPDLPPVVVTAEGVPVAGYLHRGDEPVAGSIWLTFQGHGQVTLLAGEDGAFAGVAPAEGTPRAYVTLAGQDGRVAIGRVEIKRKKGANAAELDIALPDTAIKGTVVDQDGRPQPEATVTALGNESRLVYVRCEADGSYTIVGLPPGRVELFAEAAPSSESDVVALTLREREPVDEVTLVVRPKSRLRGRVLGPSGPVPGALVGWRPVGRQLSLTAVTGSNGRFEVDLPGVMPAADIVIVAAGLPRVLRRVLASDEVVDIAIGGDAGLLVVGGPAADAASICQSGTCMPLGSFLQIPGPMPPPELDLSTGDYRIPVEPGRWSVCRPPGGSGGCTDVHVLAGLVAAVHVD